MHVHVYTYKCHFPAILLFATIDEKIQALGGLFQSIVFFIIMHKVTNFVRTDHVLGRKIYFEVCQR